MNSLQINEYLKIAKAVALKAGHFLGKQKIRPPKILNNNEKDIKLEVDKLSEAIIIKSLRKTGLNILSEENGFSRLTTSKDLLWIVDPLDGSLNYSRGLPISSISISLWHNDEPIIGVVYDFNRNELFEGVVGGAVKLNNKKIFVSNINTREQAVVATGFPSATKFDSRSLYRYIKFIQSFKKVRLLGSAAISLAYVACGRVDAYYEKDIRFWDVAAGLALVKAAGGVFSLKETKRAGHTMEVHATNNKITFNS